MWISADVEFLKTGIKRIKLAVCNINSEIFIKKILKANVDKKISDN